MYWLLGNIIYLFVSWETRFKVIISGKIVEKINFQNLTNFLNVDDIAMYFCKPKVPIGANLN